MAIRFRSLRSCSGLAVRPPTCPTARSRSRRPPAIIGAATFTYQITDGANASVPATVGLTVLPPPTTAQLFAYTDAPAILSDPDPSGVNLGVKFASQPGLITGLKYYKGAGDTGTHVGSLWASDGTLLASATFTNEYSQRLAVRDLRRSGCDQRRHDIML